jgi:molybdate transport system ATP-binding protein
MIECIQLELHKTLHTQNGIQKLSFSLRVAEHEFAGILGPSGAGKTSLLKMLAGLMVPDEGMIQVNGRIWYDSACRFSLPPEERGIGMVFQQHNLFPNMTVRENLAFALKPGMNQDSIDPMLQLLGIQALQKERPGKLSGGQCQRVALARALLCSPEVLLLDEPFASLDWTLRWRLQEELKAWQHRFGTTTLLVSHDLLELTRLCGTIHALGNLDLHPQELSQAAELYGKISTRLHTNSFFSETHHPLENGLWDGSSHSFCS